MRFLPRIRTVHAYIPYMYTLHYLRYIQIHICISTIPHMYMHNKCEAMCWCFSICLHFSKALSKYVYIFLYANMACLFPLISFYRFFCFGFCSTFSASDPSKRHTTTHTTRRTDTQVLIYAPYMYPYMSLSYPLLSVPLFLSSFVFTEAKITCFFPLKKDEDGSLPTNAFQLLGQVPRKLPSLASQKKRKL